jgi:hypothetical protein
VEKSSEHLLKGAVQREYWIYSDVLRQNALRCSEKGCEWGAELGVEDEKSHQPQLAPQLAAATHWDFVNFPSTIMHFKENCQKLTSKYFQTVYFKVGCCMNLNPVYIVYYHPQG